MAKPASMTLKVVPATAEKHNVCDDVSPLCLHTVVSVVAIVNGCRLASTWFRWVLAIFIRWSRWQTTAFLYNRRW
jgi:hypothetical protein